MFSNYNDKIQIIDNHSLWHRNYERDFLLLKWSTDALEATRNIPSMAEMTSLNLQSLVTVKMTKEVKKTILDWQLYSLRRVITAIKTKPLPTACIDEFINFHS